MVPVDDMGGHGGDLILDNPVLLWWPQSGLATAPGTVGNLGEEGLEVSCLFKR